MEFSKNSPEDIVLYNGHIRGMDKLRPYLPENYISATGTVLLANLPRFSCHGDGTSAIAMGTVLLATGFYVGGYPETDGPAGTWALAGALKKLGFNPVIVTDELCRGIFEAENMETEYIPFDADEEFCENILEKYRPVALISLERCGVNKDGEYANMRGVGISEHTAPVDILFKLAFGKILTVGIGDGGNEIGMGNIADIISTKLSVKPCVVCVDKLIISTVSNWGGYALCAFWQKETGKKVLPSIDEVVGFMERASKYGCVDGISGENVIKEDGYSPETTEMILAALKEYAENSG